jgi:hypothetical protein
MLDVVCWCGSLFLRTPKLRRIDVCDSGTADSVIPLTRALYKIERACKT